MNDGNVDFEKIAEITEKVAEVLVGFDAVNTIGALMLISAGITHELEKENEGVDVRERIIEMFNDFMDMVSTREMVECVSQDE